MCRPADCSDGPKQEREPIAIIGIGCRFPGGVDSAESFWEALKRGFDGIVEVPADRWNNKTYYDPDPNKAGKTICNKGGFVENIRGFDPGFFGLFPSVAEKIDPQQRLLLQCAYESFEDAGVPLDEIKGSKTAVFAGVFTNDWWDLQVTDQQVKEIASHTAMGVALTSIANRLSYTFDLRGPSATVDTACSSSLVCAHLACQAIWNGDTEMGLVGGVNAMLTPNTHVMMAKGKFLCPDGYCKTFDARGDGYVRGEGCGLVLLKPLSRAVADGNKIHALIRGSAVNSDGYTKAGYTVPSREAQATALRDALAVARVDPQDVDYVKAHGTGTKVGDPIETGAFGDVFAVAERTTPLLIGSVKSNIGHLEAAAGVAGLIKLALMLEHKQIPKNLHFEVPNPAIKFEEWKLQVATQLTNWPRHSRVPVGGVNSFGAGGTNAHMVLSAFVADGQMPSQLESSGPALFTISAKTPTALTNLARKYLERFEDADASHDDVCYSAATRRAHFEHRMCVPVVSIADLTDKLRQFVESGEVIGGIVDAAAATRPKLAFVCSGQGPQWFAMGRQLLKINAVYRETVQEIDDMFAPLAGFSLWDELHKDEQQSRIAETRVAQPAIMALQIGLIHMWKNLGVIPDAVVGHSVGEVAAAYLAGALSLRQAVEVIYSRSKEQDRATGQGKMLAVGLSLDAVKREIRGLEDQIAIAAVNGPEAITLSGDTKPLEQLAARLSEKNIFNKFLRVNVPFHSHHIEVIREELLDGLKDLRTSPASVCSLYSTVTGELEDGTDMGAEYWYKNARDAVYFSDAIEAMIKDGVTLFVEISPHAVLSSSINDIVSSVSGQATVVSCLSRKKDDTMSFLKAVANVSMAGVSFDWSRLYDSQNPVDLPLYTWDQLDLWYETAEQIRKRTEMPEHPLLVQSNIAAGAGHAPAFFEFDLDRRVEDYIADHVVDGTLVFPGTGHLELALVSAKKMFGENFGFLEDVAFAQALVLPDEGPIPKTRLEVTTSEGHYAIYTSPRAETHWTRHSTGRINHLGDLFSHKVCVLDDLKRRITKPQSTFYPGLAAEGLKYGSTFQLIKQIWKTEEDELLCRVEAHENLELERYNFHPALLDAALHLIFAGLKEYGGRKGFYLPVKFGRYKFVTQPSSTVWSYYKYTGDAKYLVGDCVIFNDDGQVSAELQGIQLKYVEGSRGEMRNGYHTAYAYEWQQLQPFSSEIPLSGGGDILVLADRSGVADRLVPKLRKTASRVVTATIGTTTFDRSDESVFEVDPKSFDVKEVLASGNFKAILCLWALDIVTPERGNALWEGQGRLSRSVVTVIKALVESEYAGSIWLISSGGDRVLETDSSINFAQSPLCGMGRVLVNEHPGMNIYQVDVSAAVRDDEMDSLCGEVFAQAPSGTELALRDTERFSRVLVPVAEEEAIESSKRRKNIRGLSAYARVREPGLLDSVVFQEISSPSLEKHQVLIEVRAAGLNFKDVENGLALLSDEATAGGIAGKQLGLECAGVVRAVGENVLDFKVGDEVMAWVANGIAGLAIAEQHCVCKKPSRLSFEEAAAVVVVYITAYYSLYELARAKRGERVLVHSVTGGVGIAVVRLSQIFGLEVFGTASSVEKQELARSMGVEHVYDSRSNAFHDEILRDTHGEGVDIVINSLSGTSLTQSLRCLGPFGRFIELGKTDIYKGASLNMHHLGNNISFFAFDADRLMKKRPAAGAAVFRAVADLFETHALEAHPLTTYPASELSRALQFMSEGRHVGKVVIQMVGMVEVLPAHSVAFCRQGSYLITGGASGLGLAIARWMSQKGARHLILVSRSGPKSREDDDILDAIRAEGTMISLPRADVCCGEDVERVVSEIPSSTPLKGVIHSAGILDDAPVESMTFDQFDHVFKPKVLGAWNLHCATAHLDLEMFVNVSSISAIVGIPGQTSYAAANNFLDKLALHRQVSGLRGSSINFGVLSGRVAGMTAAAETAGTHVFDVLNNQGLKTMSPEQILSDLEKLIRDQPAYRMASEMDWQKFGHFFPHLTTDSRFSRVLENPGTTQDSSQHIHGVINALASEERVTFVSEKLQEGLAKILGVPGDSLDVDRPLGSIGIDSLSSNQIRHWILQRLEFNVPMVKLISSSVTDIANYIIAGVSAESEKEDEIEGYQGSADLEIVGDGWFVRNKTSDAPVLVVCQHSFGANASMFLEFLANPSTTAEYMAVQWPGREYRQGEALFEHVKDLVPTLVEALVPFLDRPFVLWGHSFGGIVCYEIAHRLRAEHGLQPVQLVITATIAPHLTTIWKQNRAIEVSADMQSTIDDLLATINYIDDEDFLRSLVEPLKRDSPLLYSYEYIDRPLLSCPVLVFAGEQDEILTLEEARAWKQHTSGDFQLHQVQGDHWFISRNKTLIKNHIETAISKYATTPTV